MPRSGAPATLSFGSKNSERRAAIVRQAPSHTDARPAPAGGSSSCHSGVSRANSAVTPVACSTPRTHAM